jgi:hypothetical protein
MTTDDPVHSSQRGFVLVYTVLLLPFLIGVTAVAIDVGSWYLQAQRAQRAADAAALAGVVWLPDASRAAAAARDAASRNGFQHDHNANVVVERLSGYSLRVMVGTASAQVFSSWFLDEFAITRVADAEYLPPVALGSPTNALGTGNLTDSGPRSGFWLAASGHCSVAEHGDPRLARWRASYIGGYPPICGGELNPDYDPSGYVFAVELARDLSSSLTIEVYDATYDPGRGIDSEMARINPLGAPSELMTRFTVYGPDATPFDLTDNPVLAVHDIASRQSSWRSNWRAIHTIASPRAGTYYVRVQTPFSGGPDRTAGSNGFALRARVGSTFQPCTTLDPAPAGGPAFRADCPQVYALQDLPIFATISGVVAEFFLAEVDPGHAGKALEITLFDVGEGARSVEILDPNGSPAAFTWRTDCTPPIVAPAGGCSGRATVLDVSGTGAQPGPHRISASKYNDRSLILTIDLPPDYADVYAGNWWKVRYRAGASVNDRTTWSARVIGDPVRLIQ